MEDKVDLRQKLQGWQILFIVLSGVIGVTVLSNGGEALEVAGPGGMLLAYCVVGVIAVAVMEVVSEMIQLFPAPNAIPEYVRNFVDVDLAWVVGIAYWYTFSSVFATQIIAAAEFTSFWQLRDVWQIIIFYVITPLALVGINCAGVEWFGLIETIGGSLKLVMVFIIAIILEPWDYINDGFQTASAFARTQSAANCIAISIIAYGFLGLEMIAMTAYEARDVVDLRNPSRIVAYLVLFIYLFCALGQALNVKWTDQDLPVIHGGSGNGTGIVVLQARSRSVTVLAAQHAHYTKLPGLLTGCMIFSTLSAANTSLYIASRIMYGMTRKLPTQPWPISWLRHLGTTTPKTGVPGWALLLSAVFFMWLPYSHLSEGIGGQEVVQVMSISANVSGLFVWAALCLAYIRYYYWLRMHKESLSSEEDGRYDRWNMKTYKASTILSYYQPAVAWLGLIGSLLVAFVFSTAHWWNGVITPAKIASAYAAPLTFLCLWIFRKVLFSTALTHKHQKGWYVKLDEDAHVLFDTLGRLYYKKPAVAQQSRMSQQTKSFIRSIWTRRQNAPSNEQDEIKVDVSKVENGTIDPEHAPSGTAHSDTLDRLSTLNSSNNIEEPYLPTNRS